MARKVIQIACSEAIAGTQDHDDGHYYPSTSMTSTLFALCNDGTIWLMVDNNGQWSKVADIPEST